MHRKGYQQKLQLRYSFLIKGRAEYKEQFIILTRQLSSILLLFLGGLGSSRGLACGYVHPLGHFIGVGLPEVGTSIQ